jgi:hypothetical protein
VPAYDANAYFHPENFDPPLRKVAEVEAYEPDWSFDLFIVLQDPATGKVYVGSDSGCSCPTPFEDFGSLGDFIEVQSWEDVKREYDAAFPPSQSYRDRAGIQGIRNAVVGAFRRA